MPISSGALDWPVSYYTKPIDIAVTNADDTWSSDYAYKNWTWKTKRDKKRKRKTRSSEEAWLHRRRCCCCVWWWLAALLLVLLTLTLYLVFWLHERNEHTGGSTCVYTGDTELWVIGPTLTCVCDSNYLYTLDNSSCISGTSTHCTDYSCA